MLKRHDVVEGQSELRADFTFCYHPDQSRHVCDTERFSSILFTYEKVFMRTYGSLWVDAETREGE
jgi:hypothetical protein